MTPTKGVAKPPAKGAGAAAGAGAAGTGGAAGAAAAGAGAAIAGASVSAGALARGLALLEGAGAGLLRMLGGLPGVIISVVVALITFSSEIVKGTKALLGLEDASGKAAAAAVKMTSPKAEALTLRSLIRL